MKNISNLEYLELEYKKLNNLFKEKKYDLVIEISKKILKNNSKQIPFYNFLGLSYRQQGKFILAEKIFKAGLELSSNNENLLVNLGATYRGMIRLDESEKILKKVLQINPNNINALVNYANLKRDMNHFEESINLYEKANKINNNSPILQINLAGVYQIIGNFKKSKEILKEFLNKNPDNAIGHKLLSGIKKYELNDEHQIHMIQTLQKKNINKHDEATLCFALSKSYEDQKNYKKSFEFFKKANDIQKKIMGNYSINDEIKLFNKIKSVFNKTNLNEYPKHKFKSKDFIFIVGLPRSGTTLAHQILASHSKIYGAGEIVIFDQYMYKKIHNEDFTSIFEKYDDIDNKKIQEIVKEIFLKLKFIKTDKNIILDKNPLNFQWLGFIKVLFPNSKIIHCTRDLKDTALSIYKNAFDINSIIWSNNQDDIVKYISIYKDLMKFWEQKMPNFIYDLDYKKLVENEEQEIKNLVKFCGQDWEKDCLDFDKKANPIKTVSISQARKPIYKTSLNSNKEYYQFLEMFRDLEILEKNLNKKKAP